MSIPRGLRVQSYSDAIADAIGEARVKAALFTTFTLDPGFFELHGLPLLFPDRSFSHVDKAKRIQLEDALRAGPEVAVYYDRSGLAQEGTPAQLGWSRVDVGRSSGIFHPKLVLLLVERSDPKDDAQTYESLILGISSANITRHGWWENVEVAHFEELPEAGREGARVAYRDDLLALLRQLDAWLPERRSESVLERIRMFVRNRTEKRGYERRSVRGRLLTRIYAGQQPFPDWLAELGVGGPQVNLEVVSPFFDKPGTLERLIAAIQPRQARVYLPCDAQGTVLIERDVYEAVAALPDTAWARLPKALVERSGNAKAARMSPRGVHAKVYRFWGRDGGEVVVVGSVNLTAPAHSKAPAGNLEAAFLLDASQEHAASWWLERDDVGQRRVAESNLDEHEGLARVPLDVSVEYDWRAKLLRARAGRAGALVTFEDVTGKPLWAQAFPEADAWQSVTSIETDDVEATLIASSFLVARLGDKHWRLLVREENCGFKPSQLSRLTIEEILQYWSLLTPEQRQAFILDKLRGEAGEDGLAIGSRSLRFLGGAGLFQRFAGVFHAFGCVRRAIEAALVAEREAEAETRLFGNAYDSVPELLKRLAEEHSDDPVRDYVTALCARQLRDQVARRHPEFWRERKPLHPRLDEPIAALESLTCSLGLSDDDQASFLDWYESSFLTDLAVQQEPS